MRTSEAWTEIASTRDLTLFNKFEQGFRHLQRIAEQRTRTRLHFGRAFLRDVFRTYSDAAVSTFRHEAGDDGLSSLAARMPCVLAGTSLHSFDRHYFDRREDRRTVRVNISREALDANGYFILAFCVEYYLFLMYRSLGYDYMLSLDPQDVAPVEYILDRVASAPAAAEPKISYIRIFQQIGPSLAFVSH